jgi:tetratricopeptide (TPR) repeat protein
MGPIPRRPTSWPRRRERPSYGEALRKLADVQLFLGNLDGAKNAAESALRCDSHDAAARVILGRVLLAGDKSDDALRAAQEALRILPNSAAGKLLMADAYAKKGEIDLALENYQTAYGLDHGDPAPLVRASVACHAAGRDTSAKAFGMKATQDFPQWAPAWVAFGDALAGDHEIAQARAAYESALKGRGPVDAEAVRRKMSALR